jgi:hypothetical protein
LHVLHTASPCANRIWCTVIEGLATAKICVSPMQESGPSASRGTETPEPRKVRVT